MNFLTDIYVVLSVIFFSFLSTFFIIPWLIPRLEKRGITGIDANKATKVEIPEMGGLAVILGFFVGFYVQVLFYSVFEWGTEITNVFLVSVISLIGIGFIGVIDDLLGMRQRTKAVLPFFFALPLGLFYSESMILPIFGGIDLGYAVLFLIPFGITCASNAMNMLEGFNGLGTGLALIITVTLLVLMYINDNFQGAFLLIPLLGPFAAFFYYNKYPSKIFPGDTLTLFTGGAIGCAAIASDLKLEGTILMTPMIIEFFLKLKGNFKAECFATSLEGDVLKYEGDIQSLTHLVMQNFVVTERKLTSIFFIFESLLAILVITISYFII